MGKLWTVVQTAKYLGVSTCWVRRNKHKLPLVPVGRQLRFDSGLLLREFSGRKDAGKCLKSEREISVDFRRYQRGGVFKRGKKGQQVWYGTYREDMPGSSQRKPRLVRLCPVSEYPSKTDARELLRQKMNLPPSAGIKFSELVARFRQVIMPTIKGPTADYYDKMLNVHVLPQFGCVAIDKITKYDVQSFVAEKAKQAYRKNTIRGMRVSLGRVLGWAADMKWIPQNPCSGVKLPETGTKVVRIILKPEQVLAIASELEEPYATLVLFLAITGLRISEAVGVRWADIDGTELHVQNRIYEGKPGEVKTPKSRRILPLPPELIERMKTLGPGEYVFRTRAGTPLNHKNAAHRHLRPACKRLGIKLGGWHDFRHTFTTISLKEYPLKAVSLALGHASTKITTDVYQHIETEDLKAPLAGMSRQLLSSAIN